MSSVPTSSDRNGVSSATASAMYWSMLFFDCTTNLAITVTGPVPFNHAALAPMWTPPMSGLPSGAFNPLTVTTWLRNGSSGDMIGLNSKVAACGIRMPLLRIDAVRDVDRTEPERPLRGLCGKRWNHRVEERHRDGCPQGATQEGPTGEVLLRDEHRYSFATWRDDGLAIVSDNLVRIWNGSLFTIPSRIACIA
jgi:hypothetical protein